MGTYTTLSTFTTSTRTTLLYRPLSRPTPIAVRTVGELPSPYHPSNLITTVSTTHPPFSFTTTAIAAAIPADHTTKCYLGLHNTTLLQRNPAFILLISRCLSKVFPTITRPPSIQPVRPSYHAVLPVDRSIPDLSTIQPTYHVYPQKPTNLSPYNYDSSPTDTNTFLPGCQFARETDAQLRGRLTK